MGSYTTNYNLYKPAVDEEDWGLLVNTGFDTIDTQMKDNSDNIATNVTDIATNVSDIATNAADIVTNVAAIALNTTHRSSSGNDHTWIDQDVRGGSSPTFDGTNFTGIPDVITNTADIATNAADIAINVTSIDTNTTAIALNTTHRGSSGVDHGYIDQDVRSGTAPVFDGSNFTNLPTGTGDLRSDGTVPLTADWDVGAFDITAVEFKGALIGNADTVTNGVYTTDFPLNQDTTGTAANLSGTPTLPDGTAAVTQAASDNSTKLATTAYVDSQVATSDTLQEVFDNGQTITIADGDNQSLEFTQNDTTNNPRAVRITNAGTGTAFTVSQSGNGAAVSIQNTGTSWGAYMNAAEVMTSGKALLYVISNVAQTASPVAYIRSTQAGTTPLLQLENDAGTGTALELDNNSTGYGLQIDQGAILTAGKEALEVSSSVAQTTGGSLVAMVLNNAASTIPVLRLKTEHASSTSTTLYSTNDGTGHNIYAEQVGVLDSSKHAVYVYSSSAQVNASTALVHVEMDNATSTEPLVEIIQQNASSTSRPLEIQNDGTGNGISLLQTGNGTAFRLNNDGTGSGLWLSQDSVLAANQHALYVYGTPAHVNADTAMVKFLNNGASSQPVLQVVQDNASATGLGLYVQQDGNGAGVQVENAGTSHGNLILQTGVLAVNKYGLEVYSNTAQTTEGLVNFQLANASSDEEVVKIQNAGTGTGIALTQSGNGYGLSITNTGNVEAVRVVQSTALTTSQSSLHVISTAAETGTGASTVHFASQNASSTKPVLQLTNAGTGNAINVSNTGNGPAVAVYKSGTGAGNAMLLDNDGTGMGLHVKQDGVCAAQAALYVSSGAAQTTAPLVQIDQASASSTTKCLGLGQAGSGPHINLSGDPTVSSPTDGDLWYTGAELNFRDGTTTVDLLSGGASGTRGTFTNATLSSGVLTITHNLGLTTPFTLNLTVADDSQEQIIPDTVTFLTNTITVDLTSYGTLSGTWGYYFI